MWIGHSLESPRPKLSARPLAPAPLNGRPELKQETPLMRIDDILSASVTVWAASRLQPCPGPAPDPEALRLQPGLAQAQLQMLQDWLTAPMPDLVVR